MSYKVNTDVAGKHEKAIKTIVAELSGTSDPTLCENLNKKMHALKEISSNSDTVKKFLQDFDLTQIAPEPNVQHISVPRR